MLYEKAKLHHKFSLSLNCVWIFFLCNCLFPFPLFGDPRTTIDALAVQIARSHVKTMLPKAFLISMQRKLARPNASLAFFNGNGISLSTGGWDWDPIGCLNFSICVISLRQHKLRSLESEFIGDIAITSIVKMRLEKATAPQVARHTQLYLIFLWHMYVRFCLPPQSLT